ncbi:Uncharacterised protein [Propionibacterium australiense]|uniref:Uncharacterized protein n=1 Tax=Propionibacterium australiense TaxID=119981 RepID=A0A383S504_9ACTN|nr:Hypothetical protein PROPAUS_1004 [Propionibacterium australiense]VEH89100.1 Uncharacterised protein [Propionibacterium australiense]
MSTVRRKHGAAAALNLAGIPWASRRRRRPSPCHPEGVIGPLTTADPPPWRARVAPGESLSDGGRYGW